MSSVMSLYIDDSGTRNPDHAMPGLNDCPWFALGGILINDEDVEIAERVHGSFCAKWNITHPLHSVKIRSRKKEFSWLGRLTKTEHEEFMSDLSSMLLGCPVAAHGCVVDRLGYDQRYRERYGRQTWHLCKTAFTVLVERAAKIAKAQGRRLRVLPEKGDRTADNQIRDYYNQLKVEGMPFSGGGHPKYAPLTRQDFSAILYDLRFKDKTSALMQIADLYLYPISKGAYSPKYRPLEMLVSGGRTIDCLLDDSERLIVGIKYSCFERLAVS